MRSLIDQRSSSTSEILHGCLHQEPLLDGMTVASVGVRSKKTFTKKHLMIRLCADTKHTWTEDEEAMSLSYVHTQSELESLFQDPSHTLYSTRLYAIHQMHSWSILDLSPLILDRLMLEHNIMPQALDSFSAFRPKTTDLESGYVPPPQFFVSSERIEYTYVIRFAEYKGPNLYEPWTIRQYAIYHCYDIKLMSSVYILISPMGQSNIETNLLNSLKQRDGNANSFLLNRLLWDTYFDNWRLYLMYYDEQFQKLSDNLRSSDVERYSIPKPRDLYFIESTFWPLIPAFEASASIITALHHMSEQTLMVPDSDIRLHESIKDVNISITRRGIQLESLIRNVQFLLKRCKSASSLLQQVAMSKNQRIAQEQSVQVVKLTQSTVDDSVTIRVITVITLIYISATAPAAVIDTPFFYRDDTHDLKISAQFWIYVLLALSFTLATVGYWRWEISRRARDSWHKNMEALKADKSPV